MTTKEHFLANWKLYGISIGWITIIPCYYDWLRFGKLLKKDWRRFSLKYRLNHDPVLWFRSLFDTSIKEYNTDQLGKKVNLIGVNIVNKVGSIKVWAK